MSRKKAKLEFVPIVIGDYAMELHKLIMPIMSAEPIINTIQVMAHPADYEVLRELYGSSEVVTPWCKHLCDDKGVQYYAHWYYFSYNEIAQHAIKIKSKLVVDKQSLLIMLTLPALDKKNKISRNIGKKYLQDTVIVANSFISG